MRNGRVLVDSAVLAFPVGLADVLLENLSRGISGNHVYPLHGARTFLVSQALTAVFYELMLRDMGALNPDHESPLPS